jgi:hypothetical protein
MSPFFVNTQDGRIATRGQLAEAGLAHPLDDTEVEPPWHRIQGPDDASTMWYVVLRKREKGVYMGTLCFRHAGRLASLTASGWEEVPVPAIGLNSLSG